MCARFLRRRIIKLLPRSPELAAACEVWKEIKFEFETIDKL